MYQGGGGAGVAAVAALLEVLSVRTSFRIKMVRAQNYETHSGQSWRMHGMQIAHTGGIAAVGGVAAAAALLEAPSVGTLFRTWQPGTTGRLALARRCEKGATVSWNTELLLAASAHTEF